MTISCRKALDLLAATDVRLQKAHGTLRSLCPGRRRATPLAEIGEQLFTPHVEGAVAEAFAQALSSMLAAQSESFPNNLFWDFDFPASEFFAFAATDPELARERSEESRRRVVRLQMLYGSQSTIRFRYVHDFIYGFDWARWVKRDPDTRQATGPFASAFLDHLLGRGQELLELIERDDAKYGRLKMDESRNVFGFHRDPASEETLHRDLAERGLLPVEAWRLDAAPDWRKPYTEIREERARELGLQERGRDG